MFNRLKKIKEKASATLNQLNVPLPITSTMLQTLLHVAKPDGITNLNVEFVEERIHISGTAKKGISFPFSFVLTPSHAEDRKLNFMVGKVKPLNSDWIRTRVFNVPPFLTYDNEFETICIDLNEFDVISKIPVGTIKSFGITDNVLWVTLGV